MAERARRGRGDKRVEQLPPGASVHGTRRPAHALGRRVRSRKELPGVSPGCTQRRVHPQEYAGARMPTSAMRGIWSHPDNCWLRRITPCTRPSATQAGFEALVVGTRGSIQSGREPHMVSGRPEEEWRVDWLRIGRTTAGLEYAEVPVGGALGMTWRRMRAACTARGAAPRRPTGASWSGRRPHPGRGAPRDGLRAQTLRGLRRGRPFPLVKRAFDIIAFGKVRLGKEAQQSSSPGGRDSRAIPFDC